MMPRTGTTVPQDRNDCLQDRTGLLLGVRLFYLLRPDVDCLSVTIENPVSLQPGSSGRPSPGHNTWWRLRAEPVLMVSSAPDPPHLPVPSYEELQSKFFLWVQV